MTSIILWDIVDKSEEAPPSDVHCKVNKKYKMCVKKSISIVTLNLMDNQFAHIKGYK